MHERQRVLSEQYCFECGDKHSNYNWYIFYNRFFCKKCKVKWYGTGN